MALAVMVLCSQIAPVLLAQDSTPAPASAEAAAPASRGVEMLRDRCRITIRIAAA